MFEKVEALDKNKHQDLKFNPAGSYSFAAGIASAPLSYAEMTQASKFYPLVFTEDRSVPVALLSLKQGENAFVDAEGKWTVPYVPAHVRRYPFIFAKSDKEDNFVLCLDPDAPHFASDQGEPLYTANGEPTEVLNNAMEFLKRYQREMLDTEKIFEMLQEKELLVDKQFTIGSGENQTTIGGFKTVDTEKLKELDNETLGDWVKKGIMGLVYAHLHSLDNVRRLAG